MAPRARPRPRGRRGAEDRGEDPPGPAFPARGGEPALTAAVVEAAPAKVNLHLHVTGRRADGYHLLDSLVVFAGAADTLRAEAAQGLTLTLDGPEAAALQAEPDNLVLRAARALAAAAGGAPRAALTLTKRLPVASGIGGGSADAAAALRALNRLWELGWDEARLAVVAASLGADVPACVASRPCVMGGIGEVLRPAPALPGFGLVLANPRVGLATPAVFRTREGAFSPAAVLPGVLRDAAALAAALDGLRNDLQAAAVALCPAVAEAVGALNALPGCLLARMSGSGATCFGLFADAGAAQAAAERLPQAWWAWGGGLHEAGG